MQRHQQRMVRAKVNRSSWGEEVVASFPVITTHYQILATNPYDAL
jgi:hypothetical protein